MNGLGLPPEAPWSNTIGGLASFANSCERLLILQLHKRLMGKSKIDREPAISSSISQCCQF